MWRSDVSLAKIIHDNSLLPQRIEAEGLERSERHKQEELKLGLLSLWSEKMIYRSWNMSSTYTNLFQKQKK